MDMKQQYWSCSKRTDRQNEAFEFLAAVYRSAGVSFPAFYVFIYKMKAERMLKKD